ncbi:NUDIX hydrolase [Petrocella sp. FN5]|uniref:NUDIX hydrolase n=1 Tax=Petrocella sp. FN5 TaxID=3032002 RepID=UPI0023DCA943|nr:CoA pyrophosphatase [Petrocella sp. FN5]MDF1617600.1 CoA pyrophosphatase [Petrocella sp. FN5]
MLDPILKKLKKNLKHTDILIGKEDKYLNAAVLIPLIDMKDDIHVLYQVRSEHIRQGGEIGFPGGGQENVDKGDYERTAVRETSEELGIEEGKIEVIGHLGTLVAHSDVTIDVFVGVLKIDDLEVLDLNEEVASVFTVPLEILLNMKTEVNYIDMEVKPSFIVEEGDEVKALTSKSLGLPDKYDRPWVKHKRKVYFYRYNHHIIWGMTGEITKAFLDLFKD